MNVRKIIEEEINKLLEEEEEEAPPISIEGEKEEKPAAAKKITIGSINKPLEYDEFKKREKGIDSPADVYYLAPAGEVGTKSENDTIVLAHYIEGGKWEKSDVTGKTRKDIKKYSAPRVPRIKFSNDIMKLQMEINKWLASSPNNKSEMKRLSSNFRTVRGILRGDIGGEDGMWGPNTARAVFIIQSSEKGAPQKQLSPKIMPKQSDIIALTEFLKKINQSSDKTGRGEVIPAATPAVPPTEPVPSAAAPGPEKQGTTNTPFKSGEELTQYVQALVAQDKRDMLKGKKLYYMDGADKYVIPFDENGKMTSPTKIGNLTPQPPRFTGAGEGRLGPLQESKSLRGMILKEILAALK